MLARRMVAEVVSAVSVVACVAVADAQSVFLSEPTQIRNGWSTFPVLTRGETVPLLGGPPGQTFAWTAEHRRWDGLGACRVDSETLAVFINHETSPGAISRLHLDRGALGQWISGRVVGNSNATQTSRPPGLLRGLGAAWATSGPGVGRLDRPCSANLWEPHTFGYDRGFRDRLYLSGEETFGTTGHFQVIDPESGTRYEAADVGGGGSWESATLLDTGRTDTIALLLGEDQGDSPLGTAPLSLYVGRKMPTGSFLERNGLVGGTTYSWDADGADTTVGSLSGSLFGGGNAARAIGTWTTDRGAAVLFSKAEDVHTDMRPSSPGFGTRAALASQGQAVFLVDLGQLDFVAGDLGLRRRSEVSVLFAAGTDAGDGSGRTGLFDAMDNLVWSADGSLYVNEDDGEGDVWEIRVDRLLADQAAGTLAPGAESVRQILDADPITGLGIDESSGIIDISSLVGYVPGSVFLASGMGSVGDQLAMLVAPTAALAAPLITIDVATGSRGQRALGYPMLAGTTPVAKVGGGTLVLDQVNTLTGTISVEAGTLRLAEPHGVAAATLVTRAGGTAALAAGLVVAVGRLDPLAGGLLDVGSGLVTVAQGPTPVDLVTAIRSGRGTGDWNGASGITSTAAAVAAQTRAVGWRDDGGGALTFGFAAPGDTNLDWAVDLLDAADILGSGRFDTGRVATWSQGDFTYDGLVDVLDVAALMGTGLSDAGPYNSGLAATAPLTAVPEPDVLVPAAGAAVMALVTRRRPAVSARRCGRRKPSGRAPRPASTVLPARAPRAPAAP